MPAIQRNNSVVSSASIVSKHSNVTHFVVQNQDNEKARKIVHSNQILNPSNRRLKVGDACTVKGEGRSHERVKILFYGDLETCQHQMDVIGEPEINDDSELANISCTDDLANENELSPSEKVITKKNISGAAKALPVQPKNAKSVNVSNGSGKSKNISQSSNNKENVKLNQKKTMANEKSNDNQHSKKASNIGILQSANRQQASASKAFVSPNMPNRALTQQNVMNRIDAAISRNSNTQSAIIQTSKSTKEHVTTGQSHGSENANDDTGAELSADDEFMNSSSEKCDYDDDVVEDDETDQNETSVGQTDGQEIVINKTNDGLQIKYNALSDKCKYMKKQITSLQQQNEILKKTMIPMPSPEIQQWFVHTAQRFENKPLSGKALETFSTALNLPENVLISLKQDTGSLTARAIVRHLFPSKTRTLGDITETTRQSILDFVKYCHPNEIFAKGKINEAISGPFRTAMFKMARSTYGLS